MSGVSVLIGGVPDFESASMHLRADVVEREGSTAAKKLRTIANAALVMLTGELEAGVSMHDLVVTRLEGGEEVLRVSAGSILDADQLLQRVRQDLDSKTVAQFVSEWRLPDE